MEDLEYFEVRKLPTLLKLQRLGSEHFNQLKDLSLGDCLHFVELLEKIQHLLNGGVRLWLVIFVSGLHMSREVK